MKKIVFAAFFAISSNSAMAQFTDVAHIGVQLTQFLAVQSREAVKLVNQIKQVESDLKNLEKNPASLLGSDAADLIRNLGGIMQAGKSISGSVAEVDKKYAAAFRNPQADTFAKKLKSWSDASKDSLEASLRANGKRREQFASDADAIQDLYNESQNTGGNIAAIQTLSKISVKQTQQLQALNTMLADQNSAATVWMSEQATRDQEKIDGNNKVMQFGKPEKIDPANYKNRF